MKRIVLTFGLIAGAINSTMMAVTFLFIDSIGFNRGEVIGYTSMVVAFLMIFFGVRAYRENVGGGFVSFGRALAVGALIAFVASCVYVATWQVIYHTSAKDFGERYTAHVIEKERAKGASEEVIAARRAEMEEFAELYENPLFNVAITFIEALPIGLVVALVSAGILRRRRNNEPYGNPSAPVAA